MSKDGLLPVSTKRRTGAVNATGLKSSRGNSACSAIAPTHPRLKHPTTSRFSSHHATGEPRKRFSLNYQITIGDYGNGRLHNRCDVKSNEQLSCTDKTRC